MNFGIAKKPKSGFVEESRNWSGRLGNSSKRPKDKKNGTARYEQGRGDPAGGLRMPPKSCSE